MFLVFCHRNGGAGSVLCSSLPGRGGTARARNGVESQTLTLGFWVLEGSAGSERAGQELHSETAAGVSARQGGCSGRSAGLTNAGGRCRAGQAVRGSISTRAPRRGVPALCQAGLRAWSLGLSGTRVSRDVAAVPSRALERFSDRSSLCRRVMSRRARRRGARRWHFGAKWWRRDLTATLRNVSTRDELCRGDPSPWPRHEAGTSTVTA